jgi:hypothetical protein
MFSVKTAIMDLFLIFFGALIIVFGLATAPLGIIVAIVGAAICLYGLILDHRRHQGKWK